MKIGTWPDFNCTILYTVLYRCTLYGLCVAVCVCVVGVCAFGFGLCAADAPGNRARVAEPINKVFLSLSTAPYCFLLFVLWLFCICSLNNTSLRASRSLKFVGKGGDGCLGRGYRV